MDTGKYRCAYLAFHLQTFAALPSEVQKVISIKQLFFLFENFRSIRRLNTVNYGPLL